MPTNLNQVYNNQGDIIIIVDPAVFRGDFGSFMLFDATHVASKCSPCFSYLLLSINKFCIFSVPEYSSHIGML